MSDLVPADGTAALPANPPPSLLAPLTDPMGGSVLQRLGRFTAQGPVRRALPVFLGLSAVGGAALAWSALSPSPQRLLYAQLADSDRASVVASLDQAAIDYAIDPTTGALTVAEEDFYRARMLVASDGAVATPESGSDMLDSLPMGASRMLEGERLRAARERDLMLTIKEIDGVESVRVHLAEGEKSVFVRDNAPPSASVMVRLARGRQLSESQVAAITNLVAASVPGLSVDAVRVVDQHGRLLSDPTSRADSDRLELQARMEEKLRSQLAQLLTPMLGAGNFSSEIQVELDMDETTRARESYDKDGGVVRSETQAESTSTGAGQAAGVPGALSNTPPPPAEAQARPPQGTEAKAQPAAPVNGESRTARTYELGREVSVSNSGPGGVARVSVAVAISKAAMKNAKPEDLAQLKALVSAAVGASEQRGDQVQVMVRNFEPLAEEETPFYEEPWFAMLVRNGAAVLAVLLVLLLGVRPILKAMRKDAPEPVESPVHDEDGTPLPPPAPQGEDPALLGEKVDLAKRLVAQQPDHAVAALRQMLGDTGEDDEEAQPEAA